MGGVMGYLWGAVVRTVAEGWALFGGVFLLAVALWFVSQRLRGYGSGLLGRKYYWLVAPGVACHETGHALGCLLTGTKILEFVPFRPEGNTLGYVLHETKPGLAWQIGRFFIATGPVWFGCAVILLAAHLFTGEEFWPSFAALAPRPGEGAWVHLKGVWFGAVWMLQTVFAPWRWGTPLFPVFAYLVFCVASEITLSPPDLVGMWKGLAAIAAGLFLLNLVPWVSGWVELGVEALRPGLFAAQTLLFFVLLADLVFLGVVRLAWSVLNRLRNGAAK
ncbi:MAG: hypothetical protein IK066_03215 [Kiritimatiellae bacterium]|nr:hypothetical protein [Kiritimatiellia bacterium]